ncbi:MULTISPECIES: hypothetical protein [Vibrio]|uniref:Uncharacterized protein n=1 Tax=Vibrio casei TaxID=673372 RepID=A0A368LKA7_9VIBR|nr:MULTISPECIES: hypothetical protein [Vibrio]RCS72261.1 hypothetical protein CIK83_00755 [Vibrio casei]HBV76449.1 hypothetical protein [Vibrio sp.]
MDTDTLTLLIDKLASYFMLLVSIISLSSHLGSKESSRPKEGVAPFQASKKLYDNEPEPLAFIPK